MYVILLLSSLLKNILKIKDMKKLNTILVLSLLVMIFNSCDERKLTKTNTQPSFNLSEDSVKGEVIDTYYLEEEKHFDCTVQEINKEDRTKEGVIYNYSVVTECGIFFYTNKKYKIGDVLKGFNSPKHK